MFIHQTAWQSRLLCRYGQDLAFLDATYKTTKYSLPLFLVDVKTNVDYIILASSIVQDETTASITEALSFLRQWNPQWNPRHMMTDLCEEEINSIEFVFPGMMNSVCTTKTDVHYCSGANLQHLYIDVKRGAAINKD